MKLFYLWINLFCLPLFLFGNAKVTVILDQSDGIIKPFGVTFDEDGNAYIAEYEGGRVRKLQADGKLITISGTGQKGFSGEGVDASEAVFNGIHNIVRSSNGDLYISDTFNHLIRKIDGKSNLISTVAGIPQKKGFEGDGGQAKKAMLSNPISISLTPDQTTLLISDISNKRIRSLDLKSGVISTIAGNGEKGNPNDGKLAIKQALRDPRASVMDALNNIYILERSGNALRVVRPDGTIVTLAGKSKKGAKDGPGLNATFSGPKHLCVDKDGRIIIADDNNNLIRMYNPKSKKVTTILGGGATPATQLNRPHGVSIAPDGKLWICDSWNDRILTLEDYKL
jgi:sugar lactone lactonase YvrE